MNCRMIPKYEVLQRDVRRELAKFYDSERMINWAWVGEERMLAVSSVDDRRKNMEFWSFEARKSDIWIVMFPGSDTSLVQEVVWLICNDLDYGTAGMVKLRDRYGAYEMDLRENANYKHSESMPAPRFIKCHVPLYLLNDLLNIGCKVIYVARDPMDTLMTSYEFPNGGARYTGRFSSYWNLFQNDLLLYCPYWKHIKSAWSLRSHSNLFFLFYEELEMKMADAIRRISKFLEINIDDYDIDRLIEYTGILKLCKVNCLKLLTPEIQAEMNDWITENCQNTDFQSHNHTELLFLK